MRNFKRSFAWGLFTITSIYWIVLALGLIPNSEPPMILHLSVFAVWYTALDGIWIVAEQHTCSNCGNVG